MKLRLTNPHASVIQYMLCIGIVPACTSVPLRDIVPPSNTVALLIKDYCPSAKNIFVDIFTSNLSAIWHEPGYENDTDRDGLSDKIELEENVIRDFNISATASDTNNDGYSDFVVVKGGYRAFAQSTFPTCVLPNQDTDRDGVSDCTERFIRIDPEYPDSDYDNIIDLLELRMGTNPLDQNDAFQDMDDDGATNYDEIRNNTPLDVSNDDYINTYSYQYTIETVADKTYGACYNIRIQNIPLVDVTNGNLIRVFVLEKDAKERMHAHSVTLVVSASIDLNLTFIAHGVRDQVIDGKLLAYELEL